MAGSKISLGNRIRQLRKQKGLNQDQVAEAAGIDPKSLSRIECGVFNPSIDTLQGLATALGAEMQDFFFSDADWTRLQKGYLLEALSKATDKQIVEIVSAVRKVLDEPKLKPISKGVRK
jgi:transcriptional regulator with XRE-family HTH domain